MPRYHIVIADADVAHAVAIDRSLRANLARLPTPVSPIDTQRVRLAVERAIGPKRPVGSVHAVVDSFACQDGMPNCRNCGDPAHAATCAAAGHCPLCGRTHGVAPDRIVAENGHAIVEVPE